MLTFLDGPSPSTSNDIPIDIAHLPRLQDARDGGMPRADTDEQPASLTQHHPDTVTATGKPGHRDATAGNDDRARDAPQMEADEPPTIQTHATPDHYAANGASSRPRGNRTTEGDAGDTGADIRRVDRLTATDSIENVEVLPFPSERATHTPYDSTDVTQVPSALSKTPDHPDLGTNPLNDLFEAIDFNSPDFLAARQKLRRGQ